MTGEAKLLWAGLALIVIGVGGFFLLQGNDDCWSKYSTENEAITNCEVHEREGKTHE